MTEHPDELLAAYVDGTLDPSERTEIDAHVDSCDVCSEEVALARRAREAVEALTELPVPAGVEWRLRKITATRSFWTTRRAWVATGAAAAAAAIVGVFLVIAGPQEGRDEAGSGGPPATDVGAPAAPSSGAEEATILAGFAYPTYAETDANYNPSSLGVRARDLRAEARSALAAGFPESGRRFYRSADLETLPEPAKTALSCVTEAAQPEETTVPFHIEAASFEDEPAYLAAFLQAGSADQSYEHIVLYVVAREECGLLHFSSQPL